MERDVRILILEDSLLDAELLQRELRRAGVCRTFCCVDTRDEFLRMLDEFQPDLVLSDYTMPSFDGLSALKFLREKQPEVPFIFVSGSIGEERAIEALKLGATDYVLKDQLLRLLPAVRRALRDAQERHERASLEEQLRRAQKMEAIGRLAGGVAHDFNNLLVAILGYADILRSTLEPADPRGRPVAEILKAGERAASLTRQLLAFSRRQVLERTDLDLNAVVRDVKAMLERLIGEDVVLRTRLEAGLPTVLADRGQTEQVLMNLAVNARDAMPQGGDLTIETRAVRIEMPLAGLPTPIGPGHYVRLAVEDVGAGMTDEVKSHLFEPFFTTKEQGKGTGLGLSTVYGIVTQSGGGVRVESKPGAGSRFEVYLPVTRSQGSAPAVARQTAPAERTTPCGGETLLLVEDDAAVRDLGRDILEGGGFHPLLAANAEEAQAILARHQGPIHALVTDIVLPDLSGLELARLVREAHPDMRILFTSGYTAQSIDIGAVERMSAPFLQKPYRPRVLLEKVRAALDGPPPHHDTR